MTSSTRRVAAGVALVGATAVGGLTIAAIDPIGSAGAQESSTTTEAPATTEAPEGPAGEDRPGRGEMFDEVLSALVDDGTLDQGQADAVAEAFRAKAAELKEEHGPGRGGGHGRGLLREGLDTAATALGINADELREALGDDRTIAQIAEERGVELQGVVDALVAAATERIDTAVAEERLDAERADELKAELPERIQEQVETPRSERPDRGSRGRD